MVSMGSTRQGRCTMAEVFEMLQFDARDFGVKVLQCLLEHVFLLGHFLFD